ncbi:Os01g0115700 [Oryza sativa Japonica Group]|uniref:Os01g0115700 protein n=1 Tax=Oryza sativa subsp. japonica TaxID=39947 RepID=A0A0P0UXX1_ORYSJ|nr:Os01g0115700 [Oryza sativa Japonica Group]
MAIPGAYAHAVQALATGILFVVVSLVLDHVEGRHHKCPSFSCGHLKGVSAPFRRAADPPGCGSKSYELVCSDTNATILIDNATYHVNEINYDYRRFWVVDANIAGSTCPLPQWNHLLDQYKRKVSGHRIEIELAPGAYNHAYFVRCSREVKDNGIYRPVTCASSNYSFIYVLLSSDSDNPGYIESLEPSCGYLAMTLLGDWSTTVPRNASYEDVKNVFLANHPFRDGCSSSFFLINCFSLSRLLLTPVRCMYYAVLCRFVLVPLAILTFLAHKYWKTRLAIDAVEKFLQMQQVLGPTRYAYTDLTAVTSHFRDKLGQGGYGSVYKGVLLSGDVHVAVKMLNGASTYDGEEFISEVSTIGRIHHVNVVRLVGFCSEELRRALVYEYMPQGSLDKYIFSSERSFSWDKLNEIAIGIARGINYLHQGCDMQILHFDIKPHNILLDDNFVPKVADFGLAKLYPRNKSFVSDRALRGTVGYIAPEMVSRSFGVISSKCDVYSFGMLLLEMAGGRRNADPNTNPNASQSYYPSWVYGQLTGEQVGETSGAADMHELQKKLCLVGLWCIQMKSHDRPTMSETIEMLEGDVNALQVPPRPFFCDGDFMPNVMDSYLHSSELTAISEDDGAIEFASN